MNARSASFRTVLALAAALMVTLALVIAGNGPAGATGPSRHGGRVQLVIPGDVCATHCDARDPALAAGDRHAAAVMVANRLVVLHIADLDGMAWASVEGAARPDEVWLDRSFDGGHSWPDGGKLGGTTVPAGRHGWRTMMYNIDNPGQHQFGAVRACGRAGDRPTISCTSWARTALDPSNHAAAAAIALMQYYDTGSGLWQGASWGASANALTAIEDYQRRTSTTTFRYAITNTFDRARTSGYGNFTSDSMDDTGWWALAWIRAYDLTGDGRYLTMARTDTDHLYAHRDTGCGGGIWSHTGRDLKGATANALYIQLAAALHNRIPGDTGYLARARQLWGWFAGSGLLGGNRLVGAGLDPSCRTTGGPASAQRQGALIGALVELYRATGEVNVAMTANQLADAALTGGGPLSPTGVLIEPCEYTGAGCTAAEQGGAKGVFARNLAELDRLLPHHPYRAYLARQADTAYTHDRNTLDQYGLRWAGPWDTTDTARQYSALELLTAAYG